MPSSQEIKGGGGDCSDSDIPNSLAVGLTLKRQCDGLSRRSPGFESWRTQRLFSWNYFMTISSAVV